MKTLKSLVAISALLITLSSHTFAGQVDTPPVVKPPEPPTQESAAVVAGRGATEEVTTDPLLETALVIVRTFLSIL